jgi:hypothetical protein
VSEEDGWFPRAALEAIQTPTVPGNERIAEVLERFGHLEPIRAWAVAWLRFQRPRHRPKGSGRPYEKRLENGLRVLSEGRGLMDVDERTERRDRVVAEAYLREMAALLEDVRHLADAEREADRKS